MAIFVASFGSGVRPYRAKPVVVARVELLITTLCHLARLDDLRPELGVAILPQLHEAGGVRFRLPALATPPIKLAQSSIDAGELDG